VNPKAQEVVKSEQVQTSLKVAVGLDHFNLALGDWQETAVLDLSCHARSSIPLVSCRT